MADNSKIIWDYFKAKGLTNEGIAGLMGNLHAESGLDPQNLQNSFEKRLGMTDITYTQKVDSGTYKNFVKDGAGYGLAQWTYWSRKQGLFDFCKAKNKSIGDLLTQLDFLYQELTTSYSQLLKILKSNTSVQTTSNEVLFKFERPADQGKAVQQKRLSYSLTFYEKYAGGGQQLPVTSVSANSPLATYIQLSPNCTKPRNHVIDTITIHCVVGQLTAKQICGLFASSSAGASCNYAVGKDGSIGLCVEEKDRSWCTSSQSNDHRAITIEVASDTKHPYKVTDAALNALINLIADVCQRNNIKQLLWHGDKSLMGQVDKQNMTVHRWVKITNKTTGKSYYKACPGDYLYNLHGDIAARVNVLLGAVPAEQEEEEMTQEQFNKMMDNYLAQLAQQPTTWAGPQMAWAKEHGIIKGDNTGNDMPLKFCSRQEVVTMLQRVVDGLKVDLK